MSRHLIVIALLLTTGCARKTNPLKDVLPVQVQRAWTLDETHALANEEAPETVRGPALKRSLSAVYKGNGHIRVRVYEMGSETSAFALIQTWRQSDGLAFYKGPYFVVADSEGVDSTTLSGFLHALQSDMK